VAIIISSIHETIHYVAAQKVDIKRNTKVYKSRSETKFQYDTANICTYTYKSRNKTLEHEYLMAMSMQIYMMWWEEVRSKNVNSAIEYRQVRGFDVRALSFDTHPIWVRAHWSSVQVLRATSQSVGFISFNCWVGHQPNKTWKRTKIRTRRLQPPTKIAHHQDGENDCDEEKNDCDCS